ncbi:MAG: ROK family protein [Candidatus Hydrothermarchaeales archaeon]
MQIGVDIGGTNIEAALVERGKVTKKAKRNTEADKGRKVVLKNIVDVIAEVFTTSVEAIGVGIAGPFDQKKFVMLQSPHIPCLVNFPIKDFLEETFKVKVAVGNDARMFTLGVYEFEYKDVKDLVGLTLGTGVGGTAIIDGKMEENPRDTSGEIGHIVIKKNGRRCGCGARGCIEAYVSGSAIERRYKALSGKSLDAEAIADNAVKGDKTAKWVIEEAGIQLVKGLTKIVEKYRPMVIVIGGSVANTEDILEIAKKEFRKLMPDAKVKVEKSRLKDASLLGAAKFAEG